MNKNNDIDPTGSAGEDTQEIDDLRAGLYALVSCAMTRPADQDLLDQIGALEGDETPLGTALGQLAEAARKTNPQKVEEEFTPLFYGQGQGGEVLPFASYYQTGNLHDKPLADLRGDMEKLGITRGDLNKEPEDHIAYLFEMMHGLIVGRFECGPASLEEQTAFYDAHISPWARDVFTDLESASTADFYKSVAQVALAFLEIEADAFQMAA